MRFWVSQCVSTPAGNGETRRASAKIGAADISTACWRCKFRRSPCCGQRSCDYTACPLPFLGVSAGRVSATGAGATPCAERRLLAIKRNEPPQLSHNREPRRQRIDNHVRSLSAHFPSPFAAPNLPGIHFADGNSAAAFTLDGKTEPHDAHRCWEYGSRI